VTSKFGGLLEARRLQSALAGEDADILRAGIARQAVDVGDDLVFLAARFNNLPAPSQTAPEHAAGLAMAFTSTAVFLSRIGSNSASSFVQRTSGSARFISSSCGSGKPRPESTSAMRALASPFSLTNSAPAPPT
jgi:hypothetical protein